MSSGLLEPPAPSRLARLPFYYGWVNLVVASLAMTATLPGRTHGLGLITKPLETDPTLPLSEARFAFLNFWAIVIGAAVCYPIGRGIDRFGVQRTLVAVSLALGTAVAIMSQANDVATFFVALTFVRGLGQGALTVVSMAIVGKWFTRRIGIAMGIFTVLLALGFIATVVGTGMAVESFGWRPAWLGVGLSLILGLAPLGLIFVRDQPESIGAHVDAAPRANRDSPAPLDAPLGVALRQPAFWTFTLATALFNLVFSAIMLLNENVLAERGFDNQTFVMVMAIVTFSGLPANLIAGWLAGRWPMNRLMAIGMASFAASLFLFPQIERTGALVLYAVCFGVSGGIVTVIFFAVYGHAYGRRHLGAIQATVQLVNVIASAMGPLLLAWVKQTTETYSPFFLGSAIAALLAGLMVCWTPIPKSDRSVQ